MLVLSLISTLMHLNNTQGTKLISIFPFVFSWDWIVSCLWQCRAQSSITKSHALTSLVYIVEWKQLSARRAAAAYLVCSDIDMFIKQITNLW